jgi:hypothetical protein
VALGTVLGRFLALELPFQRVTALRFAFGLPAALAAVLVLGAPLTASLHDELFIRPARARDGPGRAAPLLLRAPAHDGFGRVGRGARVPVVAIAVGYLPSTRPDGHPGRRCVAVTSLVVLLLPRRGPALVTAPEARPAYAGS